MPTGDYKPRLSVVIDEEDFLALRNHLPIGFQKVIFNLIVKDLLSLFKKYGANQVIAAYVNKDISLETMCRLQIGAKDGNDKRFGSVYQPDGGSSSPNPDKTD